MNRYIYYGVPRPAKAGCWGPQVFIGLLICYVQLDIAHPGGLHEVSIHWPRRYEPILRFQWFGRDLVSKWEIGRRSIRTGRLQIRIGCPLQSLIRLFTHGSD